MARSVEPAAGRAAAGRRVPGERPTLAGNGRRARQTRHRVDMGDMTGPRDMSEVPAAAPGSVIGGEAALPEYTLVNSAVRQRWRR